MELDIDDCLGRPGWAGRLGSGSYPTKKVFAAAEVMDRVAMVILCKERCFE